MRVIRDFSKLNLPFYLDWNDNYLYQHFVSKSFCYKTRKVRDGISVNVNWKDNLLHAVKLLISYAISTAKNTTYQNLTYLNTNVEVCLKIWDEKYELGMNYERIIEGDIDNNQTVNSSSLRFVPVDPHMSYFMKPFEIHAIIRDY